MIPDHSPTPWIAKIPAYTMPELYSERRLVAQVPYWLGSEDSGIVIANAQFIERAVNSHYGMKNVLEVLSYGAGQCALFEEELVIKAKVLDMIDEELRKASV